MSTAMCGWWCACVRSVFLGPGHHRTCGIGLARETISHEARVLHPHPSAFFQAQPPYALCFQHLRPRAGRGECSRSQQGRAAEEGLNRQLRPACAPGARAGAVSPMPVEIEYCGKMDCSAQQHAANLRHHHTLAMALALLQQLAVGVCLLAHVPPPATFLREHIICIAPNF